MKLLHVAWDLSIGGAQRALFQLIKEQRRIGLEVDVLVGSRGGYYGIQISKLGCQVYEMMQGHNFDFSVNQRLREILEGYDIVHFHSPQLGLMVMASATKRPRLCYTHRHGAHGFNLRHWLLAQGTGYFLRKSFAGISANTKHAASAAAHLYRIPLEKISVIYNGLDFSLLIPNKAKEDVAAEFPLPSASSRMIVATSSNLSHIKRVDHLLKALSKVVDLPVYCLIFGDGPNRIDHHNLASQLGIDGLVTFAGVKENIEDYLQLIDVFILPSNQEESFGNAAVEAMAVGIPTIVMKDGGGLVEHMRWGGLVADDESDLTVIIRKLWTSPEIRKEMGERGKVFVREKYTLKNMISSYQEFYEMVLNTK